MYIKININIYAFILYYPRRCNRKTNIGLSLPVDSFSRTNLNLIWFRVISGQLLTVYQRNILGTFISTRRYSYPCFFKFDPLTNIYGS